MENIEELSEKDRTAVFIPKDAIMNVEISGDFLARCQSLLIGAANMIERDKLTQSFEKYKDNKEAESFEEHVLFIMLPLIHAIEEAASKQSKNTTKVFTPEELIELKKKL